MSHYQRLTLPTLPVKQQHEHRILWNDARSPNQADFFTLGYTGRKLNELIEIMLSVGVQSLIDIRQNPVSMYRPELTDRCIDSLIFS